MRNDRVGKLAIRFSGKLSYIMVPIGIAPALSPVITLLSPRYKIAENSTRCHSDHQTGGIGEHPIEGWKKTIAIHLSAVLPPYYLPDPGDDGAVNPE